MSEPSRHDFPDVWNWTPRGGYAYTQRIPCRVIGGQRQTGKRVKISVPKTDGTVTTRYVDPANVERDGREK
jgi:hypothetical protein